MNEELIKNSISHGTYRAILDCLNRDFTTKLNDWIERYLTSDNIIRKLRREQYLIETVEPLISKLNKFEKDPTDAPKIFSWKTIFDSMRLIPEEVIYTNDHKCPHCGNEKNNIQMLYTSPYNCWITLCGTGGELKICPKCGAQFDYKQHMVS